MRALKGVGHATVAPLVWRSDWEASRAPVDRVFAGPDLIVGTDIVYFAELVEPLVQTMVALAGAHTTILLANERRIPAYASPCHPASAGWRALTLRDRRACLPHLGRYSTVFTPSFASEQQCTSRSSRSA